MDLWHSMIEIVTLLLTALVLGIVFERLKQSAIIGYLIAGTVLGPHALNWMASGDTVHAMAELGVALLLFSIGLEFSLPRLMALGPVAAGGGAVQVIVTIFVGSVICIALGVSPSESIAIGTLVALSSTACVLRMLIDRTEIDSVHGRNALGVLLMQDIAVVPLVVVMTMLGQDLSMQELAQKIGGLTGVMVGMVVGFWILCNYLLPKLLTASALSRNEELPILLAIAVALGATWLAHAAGLSPALGAFAAGLLLAESPFASQIRSDVGPLRTLFVTLFFTSIGMLADLPWIWEHIGLVAGTVVAIVIAKAFITGGVIRFFGQTHRHSIATGVCLAQIGEFSLVLGQIGLANGSISDSIFKLMIAATLVSLFLTPYLVAIGPWFGATVSHLLSSTKYADKIVPGETVRNHVIVVGYGPAGQGVVETLRRIDVPVVVLELNPQTVETAQAAGIDAHVGDATRPAILDHVHVSSAEAVVITLPDHRTVRHVVEQVRAIAPHVSMIVRSRYDRHAPELTTAGAHTVLNEEYHSGRWLAAAVRRLLRQRQNTGGGGI